MFGEEGGSSCSFNGGGAKVQQKQRGGRGGMETKPEELGNAGRARKEANCSTQGVTGEKRKVTQFGETRADKDTTKQWEGRKKERNDKGTYLHTTVGPRIKGGVGGEAPLINLMLYLEKRTRPQVNQTRAIKKRRSSEGMFNGTKSQPRQD